MLNGWPVPEAARYPTEPKEWGQCSTPAAPNQGAELNFKIMPSDVRGRDTVLLVVKLWYNVPDFWDYPGIVDLYFTAV